MSAESEQPKLREEAKRKWFIHVGVVGIILLIAVGMLGGFFLNGLTGERVTVRETIIPSSVLVTTKVPEEKWYTTTTTLVQNATDAKVIIEKVIQGWVDQSKRGYVNFTQSGFIVGLGEVRGKNVFVSQKNPYSSYLVSVDEYVAKQEGQDWRVELTNVRVVIELKNEGRVLESLAPTLTVWVK